MPVFRVTYRPGDRRLLEDLEAESYRIEAGGWHVLRSTMLVIGRPREVVLLRVSAREACVERLCNRSTRS